MMLHVTAAERLLHASATALKFNLRVLSRFALDAFAFYYPSIFPEAGYEMHGSCHFTHSSA